MIIAKIQGGIGNQMFQYATGKHLAILNNTELKLDVSSFNEDSLGRKYELHNFNISKRLASREEIRRVINKTLLGSIFSFSKNSSIIKQRFLEYDTEVLKKQDKDIYFDGYWQSEKYFLQIRNHILKEFTLKAANDFNQKFEHILNKIKALDSVGVHVRRGDYVNSHFGQSNYRNIHSEGYYNKAFDLVSGKIKDAVFFMFSDDIEWCKNEYKEVKDLIFIESHQPHEDLILMSSCKHQITANSSFSWWAAWLNNYPQKIIVAPDKWFHNDWNTKDLMPASWTRI
ncbi:MAG: alpha-1,2-fucosyltransferase [Bacteroidales bacterium]|nr:alpha-1,2-fucosyltransferase [Bacteroidales bacterium]